MGKNNIHQPRNNSKLLIELNCQVSKKRLEHLKERQKIEQEKKLNDVMFRLNQMKIRSNEKSNAFKETQQKVSKVMETMTSIFNQLQVEILEVEQNQNKEAILKLQELDKIANQKDKEFNEIKAKHEEALRKYKTSEDKKKKEQIKIQAIKDEVENTKKQIQQLQSMKLNASSQIQSNQKPAQNQIPQKIEQQPPVQQQLSQPIVNQASPLKQQPSTIIMPKLNLQEQYFKPNESIIEENKQLAIAYYKYLQWYNQNKDAYSKEFKAKLGITDDIDVLMNRTANSMKKPLDDSPHEIQNATVQNLQMFMGAVQKLADSKLNKNCLAIGLYHFVHFRFNDMLKLGGVSLEEKIKVLFRDHASKINKIHYQLPQFNVKEIIFGRIFKANRLLVPVYPQINEYRNEIELIEDMGYKVDNNGKREKYVLTSERVKSYVRMIFALMSDDAYIGRLYQYLILLLNFRIHQLSSTIVLTGLECACDQLIATYKQPMKKLLQMIETPGGYCDQLKDYFTSNKVRDEVQNKMDYLIIDDEQDYSKATGIEFAFWDIDKLRLLAQQKLQLII